MFAWYDRTPHWLSFLVSSLSFAFFYSVVCFLRNFHLSQYMCTSLQQSVLDFLKGRLTGWEIFAIRCDASSSKELVDKTCVVVLYRANAPCYIAERFKGLNHFNFTNSVKVRLVRNLWIEETQFLCLLFYWFVLVLVAELHMYLDFRMLQKVVAIPSFGRVFIGRNRISSFTIIKGLMYANFDERFKYQLRSSQW